MKYTQCTKPLMAMTVHSSQPQVGTTSQPSQMLRGDQKTNMITAQKKVKRASPPAFLAAMFHSAWINAPARTNNKAVNGKARPVEDTSRSPG